MTKFTTHIHFIASGNNIHEDISFFRRITATIYKNHAIVTRDWVEAVYARKKRLVKMSDDEDLDWVSIVNENLEAVKDSDMVIVEASFSEFNQGIQTYIAAQHKKPTLVVTRGEVENHFISGISNKYVTVTAYSTEEELETIVSAFIKRHVVPEKDLRFNFLLDRRIYKYLRDRSYETGKNKSEIIRELLEKKIEDRNP